MKQYLFETSWGELSYKLKEGDFTLVLIHGFTASSDIWDGLVGHLDNSLGIVAIDLFGHGNSPAPKVTTNISSIGELIRIQCDAIYELMEHLKIDKYHLIGSSMGGWISLELATKYKLPEKCVLIDSFGGLQTTDQNFSQSVSRLFSEFSELNPDMLKLIAGAMANSKQSDLEMSEETVKKAIFPISFIWGEDDEIFNIQYGKTLSDKFSNSEFHVVKGSSHVPFRENPGKVGKLIDEFLNGSTGLK